MKEKVENQQALESAKDELRVTDSSIIERCTRGKARMAKIALSRYVKIDKITRE